MNDLKVRRLSTDGTVEYQIEYSGPTRDAQYKMRRGSYGSWCGPFKVANISRLLSDCGFRTPKSELTLLHDFYCESHFGRGTIRLTPKMAQAIAKKSTMNTMGLHVYSRMKRIDEYTWGLPTSVLLREDAFNWLYNLIKKNLK